MRVDTVFRVMWLVHQHKALNFEIEVLKSAGVDQILTPKVFPDHPDCWGATPDYANDAGLTIPKPVLARLNSVNWFEGASAADWALAGQFFDVCVLSMYDGHVLRAVANHFGGLVVWRTYGARGGSTHAADVSDLTAAQGERWIKRLGRRFFMAPAAAHLCAHEPHYLASRVVNFPLGVSDSPPGGAWEGGAARVLLACPRIGVDPAATRTYKEFTEQFDGFVYSVVGDQYVEIDDATVLGTLSAEEQMRVMREAKVLFSPGRTPDQVDFFLLEALRTGVPVVFLEGGFLDKMGGSALPGRCKDHAEAKRKVRRMLTGDTSLIHDIQSSQQSLLEGLSPGRLLPHWTGGIAALRSLANSIRGAEEQRPPAAAKKIAVILPVAYQGGSLRGAKLLAEAVRIGSLAAGEPYQVVFLALDSTVYSADDFADLHPDIKRRTFRWHELKADEARRAMRYAGYETWEPSAARYALMEDGIKQLTDCELWLVVSDRLDTPLLPLRPVVHLVFDYLQRYSDRTVGGRDLSFVEAVRNAQKILVTTEFTRNDALQYAGVQPKKVVRLPVLAQQFDAPASTGDEPLRDYFVWTKNRAAHKNHRLAYKALAIYYSRLDGRLRCMVTGVGTEAPTAAGEKAFPQVIHCGNLPDAEYQRLLMGASFLWHPGGRIDNGNLSVVEAASVQVPSLSSDYPAMREFDHQFQLGLSWMNSSDPESMALALKDMEVHRADKLSAVPPVNLMKSQHVQALAADYWKAIRECL